MDQGYWDHVARFEEGGRELVYAKAAISSDARAKEKAERFIRAMEVLEKKTYDERRAREIERVEDLSAAADRRLELQTKAIDAQINLAGRMINELGMDPERVAAAMQLAQRTSDGFTDLSHQRQLPTADPNASLVLRPQLQPPLKLLGTAPTTWVFECYGCESGADDSLTRWSLHSGRICPVLRSGCAETHKRWVSA